MINCPRCEKQNPDHHRYCLECGQDLPTVVVEGSEAGVPLPDDLSGLTLDPFRIGDRIGSDSISEVYSATHNGPLERKFFVRVLTRAAAQQDNVVEMFFEQARNAAETPDDRISIWGVYNFGKAGESQPAMVFGLAKNTRDPSIAEAVEMILSSGVAR